MTPPETDIPLTRRALLAGSGVALGGGLLGTLRFAPTWLPDPVTDFLLGISPEPPDHLWRPTVSAAHADRAVTLLEETVDRAKRLQDRVDMSSLSDDLAFHLDRADPSGGWLESARSESDPRERLFAATYGMQFAGEVVGYATVALDEVDLDALAARGRQLLSATASVRESVGEYRVSDPGRDLAALYFIERELAFSRLDVPNWVTRQDERGGESSFSPHDIASAFGSLVQARQRLRNARYYWEGYRGRLGDDARSAADALQAAVHTLTAAIDEFPTREAMRTTLEDDLGLTQETPYGAARWELFTLCYDNDFRAGFDEGGYREDHTVQRVVALARALLARRAHGFALKELDVASAATDYDSGRALQAKRRAVRTFRSVRDEHGSPFAGVLMQQAADHIRAGDVGVRATRRRDDRPAWQARVEATTYYLVGTGALRELGGVLETVLGDVPA